MRTLKKPNSQLVFHQPEDLLELSQFIVPSFFIKEMKNLNLITEISDNYSRDCYQLCNNAVAYMIRELKRNASILSFSIEVVEGYFENSPHTWIKIGDYYVDLTLAQFIPSAPKLSILLREDALQFGFTETIVYEDWKEWIYLYF